MADSASNLAALNFMRAQKAILVGPDLRMHFDFERMKQAIAGLVVQATQLIQIGERVRARAFFAQHRYDLENRRAQTNAFTGRVIGAAQAETYTETVTD